MTRLYLVQYPLWYIALKIISVVSKCVHTSFKLRLLLNFVIGYDSWPPSVAVFVYLLETIRNKRFQCIGNCLVDVNYLFGVEIIPTIRRFCDRVD